MTIKNICLKISRIRKSEEVIVQKFKQVIIQSLTILVFSLSLN